jgi:oligopeptidase A
MTMTTNPLLLSTDLPLYSQIRPEHVEAAIVHTLEANLKTLSEFLPAQLDNPTWEGLLKPLEDMNQRLLGVLQPIDRLAAEGNDEIAALYKGCLERIGAYEAAILQNQTLQGALLDLQASPEALAFEPTQKAALDLALRTVRLAGVGFSADIRRRHQQLTLELEQAYREFDRNTRNARLAWEYLITDRELLAGLSPSIQWVLAANARLQGLEGWLVTLELPIVKAILSQADHRPLREEVFAAYHTQASDRGPRAGLFDNTGVIQRILDTRHELAQVSGYSNYASRALATRMFDTPADVESMLEQLTRQVLPQARHEVAQLNRYAADLSAGSIEYWDLDYYKHRYIQQHFGVVEETLREYFPLDTVVAGLGRLAQSVFHVEHRTSPDASRWHESVNIVEVIDDGECIGLIYLDLYSRPGKRPGTWMQALQDRHRFAEGRLQKPIAMISCDFLPGSEQRPALLNLEEVKSLLHEYGHALHHVLTTIDHASVAGIKGVADDAVEFPSTLFEQWANHEQSVALLSGHYQTGERLPAELLRNASLAERQFQALDLLRQIEFSLIDYRLHNQSGKPLQEPVVRGVLEEVATLPIPSKLRYLHTFGHLFTTGNYAAGYYTYVWSRVLSAAVFSRFAREGVLSPEAGKSLKELVLAPGGTWPMGELVEQLTREKPDMAPLLKELGIDL